MSKSFHLPFPPALSPFHPRPHQHPKATLCPTTPHVHASKQARAQASAVNKKKPPTTALSIFGLLRQGLKRRAAFSAASKLSKPGATTRVAEGEDLPQGPGGGEKKKKYFKRCRLPHRLDGHVHIYTFNEDNSILWSFSPLLFLLFFSSFSLCYIGQENVIGTLSLCRCDLLGRCVTATFSSRTMYSGCHSPSCLYGRIHED